MEKLVICQALYLLVRFSLHYIIYGILNAIVLSDSVPVNITSQIHFFSILISIINWSIYICRGYCCSWLVGLVHKFRVSVLHLIFVLLAHCFGHSNIIAKLKFDRIAEFFAFLICTKWYNPDIHRNTYTREAGSSSITIRYLDWNRGLIVSSNEEQRRSRCNLQEIGGHLMKIPLITFQILLFMRLEVYIYIYFK